MENNSRLGMARFPQALEGKANVEKEAGQIRQQNIVEFLSAEIQLLSRAMAEFQIRMFSLGQPDHLTGDVNAYPPTRPRGGEQVARTTPYFENTAALRDVELCQRRWS